MPSGLRNGAKAPEAFNLAERSVSQLSSRQKQLEVGYKPLHNVVILLQPRIIDPIGFPAPVRRLVDVDTHIDRPNALLGMALNLRYDVLAGQRCPIDLPAQRVDDIAESVIAGNSVIGVFD